MRRILLSVAMIVFVVAAIVGGTGAFFSDTETSTGNVFAAGGLDLRVDSVAHYNGMICFDDGGGNRWIPGDLVIWDAEDEAYELVGAPEAVPAAIEAFNEANPALNPMAGEACGGTWAMSDLGPEHTFFDFGDLKPGDNGENTISIHVFDNDAYMCAAIHDVKSNDNGCTEPESGDAGDTTCGNPGVGEGELDTELNFLVWEDDGDNILNGDETPLYEGLADDGVAGVYPLYTPQTEALIASTTKYLGVAWCYGTFNGDGTCNGAPVTNLTQTDSLTANISFYVEQARNNGDFVCPGIAEFEGQEPTEPEVFVGALLSDYEAPAECSATVGDVIGGDITHTSIQTAIDESPSDSTVCVDETYSVTGDDSVIHVTDGIDLVALTQGIVLDVPVSLDDDDTMVAGFAPTMGQIESPSEIAVIYVNDGVSNFKILSNVIAGPAPGGNVRGIVIETGASTGGLIENNTIANFTTGITLNTASNMTIRYNDIEDNTAGIAYDGGANVGTTNIVNNDFSGNSENLGYNAPNETVNFNINNLPNGQVNNYVAASILNAEDNWWGGDGPVGQIEVSGTGTVDADPETAAAYPHSI